MNLELEKLVDDRGIEILDHLVDNLYNDNASLFIKYKILCLLKPVGSKLILKRKILEYKEILS